LFGKQSPTRYVAFARNQTSHIDRIFHLTNRRFVSLCCPPPLFSFSSSLLLFFSLCFEHQASHRPLFNITLTCPGSLDHTRSHLFDFRSMRVQVSHLTLLTKVIVLLEPASSSSSSSSSSSPSICRTLDQALLRQSTIKESDVLCVIIDCAFDHLPVVRLSQLRMLGRAAFVVLY
jgi:hypothetical protein